jgi:hypothetical protein
VANGDEIAASFAEKLRIALGGDTLFVEFATATPGDSFEIRMI